MADPLAISTSVLAIVTGAVQSTKSLHRAVGRFKDRNKTLRRLQNELEDIITILNSLMEVIKIESSMLTLLRGPVDRCSQVCREFEQSMNVFSGRSKASFLDWTKMEFMRGDINEFIDTIAGYKSTITVGLGTITMRSSKISNDVLEEYGEMIKDTAYDLKLHLHRIDEKMAQLTTEKSNTPDISVDLKDERAVTKQCLRICEDARSYIGSLTNRESSILQQEPQEAAADSVRDRFEAQMLTNQALDKNRDSFAEISARLRERLESLILHPDSDAKSDSERLRLQADIDISKQCLEVCKAASSQVKIHTIGEAIADGDSDQVVVTTLADLFDVKKALSKGNSAQLIGSMTDETLQLMTEKRYASRFGASNGNSAPAQADTTASPPTFDPQTDNHSLPTQIDDDEQPPKLEATFNKPSPNEMRKRMQHGGNGPRKDK